TFDIGCGCLKSREAYLGYYLAEAMDQDDTFDGVHPRGLPLLWGQGSREERPVRLVIADFLLTCHESLEFGLLEALDLFAKAGRSRLYFGEHFLVSEIFQSGLYLGLAAFVLELFEVLDGFKCVPDRIDGLLDSLITIGERNHAEKLWKICVAGVANKQ